LKNNKGYIKASTDTDAENNKVEKVSVVKTRDKEVGGEVENNVVIKIVVKNNKVIKAAINNNKVVSDFNNSKDADYKESSKRGVSDNKEEGGLSEVEVDKSNNKNAVGDNKNTIRDNKNISGRKRY
jgi:hypothetical protein